LVYCFNIYNTRIKVHNILAVRILLYGSEIWTGKKYIKNE